MKFFRKGNHLILVFFGTGLLCFHARLHAMNESDSSEFQDIIEQTPAHEALLIINKTIEHIECDYRILRLQQLFQHKPSAIKELVSQLNRVKDAFQTLSTTIFTPGPSRSLNTRCAQLSALINRILIHIERAQQTLVTDLATSQKELSHACELKRALSQQLCATTVDTGLAHECERSIVHIATSADRLQKIAPKKLSGFCAGLASLAQATVAFTQERKQEQLQHASSTELLEQLQPITKDSQPAHTPTRIERASTMTDHVLSKATDILEENKGQDLTTANTQQGLEFVIDPTNGPTTLRIAQRIPDCILRRMMPFVTATTADETEKTIRILKSSSIQPSDYALLHPKLLYLFGVTKKQQEWAKKQIPAVLQTATHFLHPDKVTACQKQIKRIQTVLPVITETATSALKKEEQQAASLRDLGKYDGYLQHEHRTRIIQQATKSTTPLTPAEAILLGTRTPRIVS